VPATVRKQHTSMAIERFRAYARPPFSFGTVAGNTRVNVRLGGSLYGVRDSRHRSIYFRLFCGLSRSESVNIYDFRAPWRDQRYWIWSQYTITSCNVSRLSRKAIILKLIRLKRLVTKQFFLFFVDCWRRFLVARKRIYIQSRMFWNFLWREETIFFHHIV